MLRNISQLPNQVKVDREKVKSTYNNKDKTLTIVLKWDSSEEKTIEIELKK